jgi:hypothetical protein
MQVSEQMLTCATLNSEIRSLASTEQEHGRDPKISLEAYLKNSLSPIVDRTTNYWSSSLYLANTDWEISAPKIVIII